MRTNKPELQQIKASAGSGKTYALTGKYIAKLMAMPPGSRNARWGCSLAASAPGAGAILAITFTNAAAAEMRARVIRRLKEIALGLARQEDGPDAAQAAQWLDVLLLDMNSLNIRTIDSLLHLIVRSSALELGLNPDFEPAFSTWEAYAPHLERYLERAATDGELRASVARAIRASVEYGNATGFLGVNRFQENLKTVLEAVALGEFRHISPQGAIESRLNALASQGAQAAARFLELAQGGLKAKAAEAVAAHAGGDFAKESAYSRKSDARELFLKARSQIGPEAEEAYHCYAEAAARFYQARKILKAGARLGAFVEIARQLHADFNTAHAQSAVLPAALIPGYAARALKDGAGVSEALCRLGSRLTHFLVDEFQDTSRKQWQVLRFLTREALARGGSLAWAGDVKQSIYSWRGGDSDLFDAVLKDEELLAICPVPKPETLSRNWRSGETIVRHNGQIFAPLAQAGAASEILGMLLPEDFPPAEFAAACTRVRGAFADARQECTAPAKASGYVSGEEVTGSGAEELNANILERLRQLVTERIRGRRPWSDVLILCRSNERSAQVAAMLLEAGCPVITENSLLLAGHPLIAQLLAFLGFVYDQTDDIAFLGVITGSAFLGSDAAASLTRNHILAWAAASPERPLSLAFRKDFPQAWGALAPFVDPASPLTPYDLAAGWSERLQLEARFPESGTFIRRFLEIVFLVEEKSGSSLASFLDYWAAHCDEERAPMPESMDAIRVMTIHKAKGLEAPVVIVPWTNFPVASSETPVLARFDDLRVPVMLGPAAGQPYCDDLARQALEALNLLYVAFTRARDELYFFMPARESQRGRDTAGALRRLVEIAGLRYPLGRPGKTPAPGEREEAGTAPSQPAQAGFWLPRLKVFRAHPASPMMTPNERGLFLHSCLERLRFGSDPAEDADMAYRRELAHTIFNVPSDPVFRQTILRALRWFASLPQARAWLRNGWPEQSLLMPGRPGLLRCDLLVPFGEAALIIDYKTGQPEAANVPQLREYLTCVAMSGQFPAGATGLLIYLDLQRFRLVTDSTVSQLLAQCPDLPFC